MPEAQSRDPRESRQYDIECRAVRVDLERESRPRRELDPEPNR